jgi:hypothetical protein
MVTMEEATMTTTLEEAREVLTIARIMTWAATKEVHHLRAIGHRLLLVDKMWPMSNVLPRR